MSNPLFKRGATPTPCHKLLAATPFRPASAAPPQFAVVPPHLSNWGNDQYGDCVTAEEAFAKAAYSVQCGLPETFVTRDDVITWARQHGVLNGAMLDDVMDKMARDGLPSEGKLYTDGPYLGVDYSNEAVLQAAISQGPVKIGIAADGLPSTAGSKQGWFSGNTANQSPEDHCVSLCGYGPASWLYEQLGVALPAGLPAETAGYLLFTWGTIGFVTHGWIMGSCYEAWLRTPTTVGQVPGPPPPVHVCPSGQHWDESSQACVDDPPAPPAPPTFTVNVPQQPCYVNGALGRVLTGHVPAFTVTGTINQPAGAKLPWLVPALLALAAEACKAAPAMPSPYKEIAAAVCAMLPKAGACDCRE